LTGPLRGGGGAGEGGEGEGKGREREREGKGEGMWRGPKSGLPRGSRWLSAAWTHQRTDRRTDIHLASA